MKLKLLAAVVAATFAGSAAAKDVSYNNASIGWSQSTFDVDGGSDLDLDGISGGLSFDLANNWYLKLDATRQSGEESGVDLDMDLATVNLGFNTAMSANTDFIAELGYARSDVEASFGGVTASEDEGAANALVGFRGMATDNFEWGASVQHMDFDDSMTFVNLEGRYHFTENFSLGLEGKFESDVNIYALEARFDF
ncbi:outer membrane beta-barrel protein [Kangiella marina]|uniref:Outer membrane protein beta-barrel domain-containing protein n=1 Tax=Kangiella marina TaxID=1079178 RepID=A0ABP8INZ0_9GAMM